MSLNFLSTTHALEYNADVNRGACIAGYTRSAPGICLRNGRQNVTIPPGAGCQTIDFEGPPYNLPIGFKSLYLVLRGTVISQNAIARRGLLVNLYPNIACTSGTDSVFYQLETREEVVAGFNNPLAETTDAVMQPVSDGYLGIIILRVTGTETFSMFLIGYSD